MTEIVVRKKFSEIIKNGDPFQGPKEKITPGHSLKVLVTGGHLTPAIAVCDELIRRKINNIVWVGHRHSQVMDKNDSVEFKYVNSKGIKFVELVAGKLFRVWNGKTIIPGFRSLINIPIGFIQSLIVLLKEKPDLVISFGGYLALPIVISAFILRIPRVTHEQTIVTGLSNRIIAKFCNKIFISWKQSIKYFNPSKTIYSGNPVRKAIFDTTKSKFSFSDDLPTIYITGGNQGASTINKVIVQILPSLLHDFNVIHQTGNSSVTGDFEKCKLVKDKLPEELSKRYFVKDYVFEDEIGTVFDRASIIIARSGANTCYELMALNKYSILIPIPTTSQNEQLLNARALEEIGLSYVIEQKDLTPEHLNKAIFDVVRHKEMNLNLLDKGFISTREKTQALVKLNSAEIIIDESLKLL